MKEAFYVFQIAGQAHFQLSVSVRTSQKLHAGIITNNSECSMQIQNDTTAFTTHYDKNTCKYTIWNISYLWFGYTSSGPSFPPALKRRTERMTKPVNRNADGWYDRKHDTDLQKTENNRNSLTRNKEGQGKKQQERQHTTATEHLRPSVRKRRDHLHHHHHHPLRPQHTTETHTHTHS